MPEKKEKYHDRRGRSDELKVEKVIHLSILRDEGTEADKIRIVKQYYNMDGDLILNQILTLNIIKNFQICVDFVYLCPNPKYLVVIARCHGVRYTIFA